MIRSVLVLGLAAALNPLCERRHADDAAVAAPSTAPSVAVVIPTAVAPSLAPVEPAPNALADAGMVAPSVPAPVDPSPSVVPAPSAPAPTPTSPTPHVHHDAGARSGTLQIPGVGNIPGVNVQPGHNTTRVNVGGIQIVVPTNGQ